MTYLMILFTTVSAVPLLKWSLKVSTVISAAKRYVSIFFKLNHLIKGDYMSGLYYVMDADTGELFSHMSFCHLDTARLMCGYWAHEDDVRLVVVQERIYDEFTVVQEEMN